MIPHYRFERRYLGPIEAVIMDWAGTTVDFGSMAPDPRLSASLCQPGSTDQRGGSPRPHGHGKT